MNPGRRTATLLSLAMFVACGDSTEPDLHGTPVFRLTIDGAPHAVTPYVGCGDYALLISFGIPGVIPNASLIRVVVGEMAAAGDYTLADTTDLRYARTSAVNASSPTYRTTDAHPGRVTVSGVSFSDSLVAGSFDFRLTSAADPSDYHLVTGSFLQPLRAVYTVQHPEGTPCSGAP